MSDASLPARGRRGAAPRSRGADRNGDQAGNRSGGRLEAAVAAGMPGLVVLFIASLLIPVVIPLGPVSLPLYRLLLLLMFFPALAKVLGGKLGKPLPVDWLMLSSAIWAALAILINSAGMGEGLEPAGSFLVEFCGSYLLARVAIRSSQDFVRMVKVLFFALLILLPFAIIESVSHKPLLLDLIPFGPDPLYPTERFGLRRAQLSFGHPILYGVYAASLFGLVWWALKPGASFVYRCGASFVVFLSMFLSLSSGAVVGFAVQGVLILWELITRPNPKRWRIFVYLVILGYIALDLVVAASPFHTFVRYATFSFQSSYTRILTFEYGTQTVMSHPLFGIGVNPWVDKPGWLTPSVDNFWLLYAMRYGIPAFALFIAAIAWQVRAISRSPLASLDERACRAALLTAFGGLVIGGGTVHYWNNIFAYAAFLFGAGIWMIRPHIPGFVPPDDEKPRRASSPEAAVPAPASIPVPARGRPAAIPKPAAAPGRPRAWPGGGAARPGRPGGPQPVSRPSAPDDPDAPKPPQRPAAAPADRRGPLRPGLGGVPKTDGDPGGGERR